MATLDFHPVTLADRQDITAAVANTENRNCDLNFLNIIGWQPLYGTQTLRHGAWQLFRFTNHGHAAYLVPVGKGDLREALPLLLEDAEARQKPFLMLGVCEHSIALLDEAMPGYFYATADRNYTDYVYLRQSLATLQGKKLQPKRNHVNKFLAAYPDYAYEPLAPCHFQDCLDLEQQWSAQKAEGMNEEELTTMRYEREAMAMVFRHWEELEAQGGVLRVGGRIAAFTYGAAVNHDTFDVCVEKADAAVIGSYAMINRELARHLPERFTYINREEDMGIEGLRKAKLSYHPHLLLHKYAVMTRHPLSADTP